MKHAKPTNFSFIFNPAEFIIRRRRSVIRTSAAFLSDSSRIFSFDWRNAARDRRLFDRPVRTLDRNIIHLLSSPFTGLLLQMFPSKVRVPQRMWHGLLQRQKRKQKSPTLALKFRLKMVNESFFLKKTLKKKSSKSVVYGGKVGRLFSHATG